MTTLDLTFPPGKQLDHQQALDRQKVVSAPISLLLHDIQNPSNVGGLFRLADALGLAHIYLSGSSPSPDNRKVRQAARQAQRWQSWSQHHDIHPLINEIKQRDIALLALEITEHSLALDDFCNRLQASKGEQAICLVLGREDSGVAAELLAQCQAAIHIPMQGRNSSMNLVSAASIACYSLNNSLGQP